MKYRAEIDGLRALAVLPVILFHAGFESFSGGFVGVDIFFVISGYLITTIIISEMAEDKFSVLNFFERRARRILPALFFVMLMCLPFAWFWLAPNHLKDFGQSLVAVSTFSSNFLFWLESGYFDTAAEIKPLLHTWSLAVEEQYYIIFPIFLMLAWRLGVKWVLSLLAIVFVISLGTAQWGAYNRPSATFYFLSTRGWELLIGVFAAFYLKHNGYPKSLIINQALSLLGFGVILYSIVAFDKTTPFPGFFALVPTLGTSLLILSAVPNTFIHKVLSLPPIVSVGLISYSAYLWHQPILAFARHRILGEVSDLFILFLCLCSLILAYISWRWVERPFKSKSIVSRKKIIIILPVFISMFISIGMFFHFKDGLSERFSNRQKLLLDTSIPAPPIQNCQQAGTKLPKGAVSCQYFGEEIEWATFGDSHMVETSYSLAKILNKENKGLMHNTFAGCRPVFNESSDPCSIWTMETLNEIVKNEGIKNVVVSFRLAYYLYGDQINIYPNFPNEKSDLTRKKIWSDLLLILNELVTSGKNVYYIMQPPELPYPIEKLILLGDSNEKKIKGVERHWWEQRIAFINDRLDSIPAEVTLIDPKETFCDDNYCYVENNNYSLYFDGDHLSVYGSQVVLEKIFPFSE